ncbi:MAG: hypothetical protein IJJ76_01870 [Ruminococcus sp.]|uniref:hypothetical protein n=1 Tax=Ruminococcus sp. TaxID=41978 RepID=UPI0025F19EF0|nr:hypothetical protein [Ruminococcus sp.]MBR0528499.1 hypothetical protein [Ruminococcus sp.]
MARIKAFRFEWTDAWHNISEGFDSILETSDNGAVSIQFLVNGKPFQLKLTDKEDDFIEDMKILKKWNKREYINDQVLDGTMWSLHFTYDNTAIAARGMNGFPANFLDFLNILHQRYGVPKAVIEDERYIRQDIKHTKTVEVFDIDDRAMYL